MTSHILLQYLEAESKYTTTFGVFYHEEKQEYPIPRVPLYGLGNIHTVYLYMAESYSMDIPLFSAESSRTTYSRTVV